MPDYPRPGIIRGDLKQLGLFEMISSLEIKFQWELSAQQFLFPGQRPLNSNELKLCSIPLHGLLGVLPEHLPDFTITGGDAELLFYAVLPAHFQILFNWSIAWLI